MAHWQYCVFPKLAQSIVTYIQNISISWLKQKANRRKKQDLFLKFENSWCGGVVLVVLTDWDTLVWFGFCFLISVTIVLFQAGNFVAKYNSEAYESINKEQFNLNCPCDF